MLWILAGIIFCICINAVKSEYGIKNKIHCIIANIFFGGFLGFVLLLLFGSFIGVFAPTELYIDENINIYSIEDNVGSSGSFILGTGTVEQSLYYYYLEERSMGYIVNSMNASNVYLRGTTDINPQPRIEIMKHKFKSNLWYLIAIPFWQEDIMVMYVPEKTVKINYNIDLQ